jgi:hypothetical protein
VALHDGGVFRNALMSESRGDQFALLAVLLTLAGKQAIAEQWPGDDAEAGSFLKICGTLDKDFLNEFRRIDENDGAGAKADAPDGSHSAAGFFKHP